jgi:RND family efflux transporter MFP subunit
LSASGDPKAGAPPVVAIEKVARANLVRRYSTAADFRPYQEINVYAKVPGYMKSIRVDIGDHVRKGQVLATLEIPELLADLQQAQAAVARSQEELRKAQDELDTANSAHDVAHLQFNRFLGVAKEQPGALAQQEIDASQGHDREAESGAAAAEAGLAAARQQLEADRAALRREQSLIDYSRIVAPFEGVITQRFADTGAMLAAGTSSEKQALPVAKLAQDDLLRLDIPVPEAIVPGVRIGMPVTLTVETLGRSYEGKVARFSGELDPATRTMTTEIDVPNPDYVLVPGMYATASLTLETRQDALTLPIEAVSRDGDRATVLKLDERDKLVEQPIEVGLEEPTRVEILSGLKEGDRVVIGGRNRLRPGDTVTPQDVHPSKEH